ncbi:hypothetical protein JAAARDRAFT_29279 [Jaapia argillacea MUCL 33604]|uniref:WD repeat-containing protein 75 second beta-propeller domain-containing protein n=1 Tax=Jaapia argillacea MUCL 33604 TaxID=933084 RepID=A0A067QAS1_9AGAM|nr:hypothetical protein JAAARDRAFT_29279 [Jaapia argillacea MUCL 33604]
MAASKHKNSSIRPPSDIPRPSSPQKPSQPRKSKKGKGKEEATSRPAQVPPPTNESSWNISENISEELSWAWTSLADSSASRCPPVFTRDGSYFFSIVGSSIKVYSVATGQVVSTLSASFSGSSACRSPESDGHTDLITSAILSPHNPFQLITGSLDGCIKIWDFLDAVLLQTIDIAQPILHLCAHEKFKEHVFVAVNRPGKKKNSNGNPSEDNAAVLQVSLKPTPSTTQSRIQKSSEIVSVGKTRLTAGLGLSPSGAWLIAIAGHKAYVADTSSLKSGFTKFVSPEALTCLAVHPVEEYFATGDGKGNIRLWYCLSEHIAASQAASGVEKKAQTTTLRWHAHAVSSLAFTSNGAYLLSGGEESVLVIWQLHTGKKEFVPRVGSPIISIALSNASEREEEYLLGLADASFAFINAGTMKISKTISRIKLDPVISRDRHPSPAPTPLAFHSISSTLILPSSHPSSLQTYSLNSSKLISELEVSPSNRVSRRDEKHIEPSRVERAVISSSSDWMATIDSRQPDDAFRGEMYLKLWWWDRKAGVWILNTRIDRPHGLKKLTSVTFSPTKHRSRLLLVTTGEDGYVKTWGIRTLGDKDGETEEHWVVRSASSFGSEFPVHAAWSSDGSILAISFRSRIILYDPVTNASQLVISSPECKIISSAHFMGRAGRYLIAVGQCDTVLWDLLLGNVAWHYRSSMVIDMVVPHQRDESVALFQHVPSSAGTGTRTVVSIFGPTSATPVQSRSLPFQLSSVTWQLPAGPSTSSGLSPYTLVGVTTSWSVVLFGDEVCLPVDVGASAQDLGNVENVGQRRSLFQDIFGLSNFVGSSPDSSSQPHLPVKPWTGTEVADIFDAPAYLMPPIETLFESLMEGLLEPVIAESNDTMHLADGEDATETVDIEMDEGSDTKLIVGTQRRRVVDEREMDTFFSLFKEISLQPGSCHDVRQIQAKGSHLNGVSKSVANGNGHHHQTTTANGLTPRSKHSVLKAQSIATPVSSVSTPVAAGKKRKKSLG